MAASIDSIPVLPPPPGETSNFDDPPSRANQILVVSIILPIISTIFVAARLFTRIRILRTTSSDDYFSVAALVSQIGYAISLCLRLQFGEGRHLWDVRLVDFVPFFLQYYLASAILATTSVSLAKISILLFYRHLFGVSKKFRIAIHLLIFCVVGLMLSTILSASFGCTPINKGWYPEIPGHCINDNTLAIAVGAINTATDCAVFVLPLPIVKNLRLPLRLKLGLALVFMTGGIVCVLSAVRLYATIAYTEDLDTTWEAVTWDTASLFEYNFAIICGCMPIVKSLIQYLAPNLLPESFFGSTVSSRNRAFRKPRSAKGLESVHSTHAAGGDFELGPQVETNVGTVHSDSQEYLRESWRGDGIVKTVQIDSTTAERET